MSYNPTIFKIDRAMQTKHFFLGVVLSAIVAGNAFSQSTTVKGNELLPTEVAALEPSGEGNDWGIFEDEENELLYIDFETLNVNLSDISVKDQAGEVVFKEDVFELPVNTIYELDLSSYADGVYEIELRSFTGVIRRRIEVE